MDNFIQCLLDGNNNPSEGSVVFNSSDHIRYENGVDVSGHNYGCKRRLVVEKNIKGMEGYTVTVYNLDGNHPIWRDNVQMSPKRMKIVSVNDNAVELRGYGYDETAVALGIPLSAASFSKYGIVLYMENSQIEKAELKMHDRNTSIVYFK